MWAALVGPLHAAVAITVATMLLGCGAAESHSADAPDRARKTDVPELIIGPQDATTEDTRIETAAPKNTCEPGAPASILALCAASGRQCVMTTKGAVCGQCLKDYLEGDGVCHKPTCHMGVPGTIVHVCSAMKTVCQELDPEQPAICGDCIAGFVNDAGGCRPVVGCEELQCLTKFHRKCTSAGLHTDAVCSDCLPGVQPVEPGDFCLPQNGTTCDPGAQDPIDWICAEAHRKCVQAEDEAYCGDCSEGFNDIDGDGNCEPNAECEDLACHDDSRVCVELPHAHCGPCLPNHSTSPETGQCVPVLDCDDLDCQGQGLACAPSSVSTSAFCYPGCEAGKALHIDNCVLCAKECSGVGMTGDLFVLATLAGACICETEPGYFLDPESLNATSCDADGDGWTSRLAAAAIGALDPAIAANARCLLRHIDGITLINNLSEQRALGVTEVSGIPGLDILALYEPAHLDDQQVDAHFLLPRYPTAGTGRGRRLGPAKLNPLTKYCTLDGDFNGNGIADIGEWHHQAATVPGAEYLEPFVAFAYFAELHRGWYQEPANDQHPFGHYVIREKGRGHDQPTDDRVPVVYDAHYELAHGAQDEEQIGWLDECPVWVHPDYVPGMADAVTMDFALWGPPEPSVDFAFTSPPHVQQWDGMNHHSQFRCVHIVETGEDGNEPYQIPLDQMADEHGLWLQANDCAAAIGPDGAALANPPVTDTANPLDPVVECAPLPLSKVVPQTAGWAAVRYRQNADYRGGCINQCWSTKGRCGLCGAGVWLNQEGVVCGVGAWEPGYAGVPQECSDADYPPTLPLSTVVCDDCPWQEDCDDGSPCTADLCHGDGQCVSLKTLEGGPCTDDGNSCTHDHCVSGECLHHFIGEGAACDDDGNECTVDYCTKQTDGPAICEHDASIEGQEWPCTQGTGQCLLFFCDGQGQCGIPVPGPMGDLPEGTEPTPCVGTDNSCVEAICDGLGACGVPLGAGHPCPDDGNECTDDYCQLDSGDQWSCHHDATVTVDCGEGLPETCYASSCLDGSCMANGDCAPSAEQTCELCGTRACGAECQWGDCDVPDYLADEYEPNEGVGTAYDLGLFADSDNDTPMTVAGYLYPPGDQDHFSLSVLDQGIEGKPVVTLIFEPPVVPPGDGDAPVFTLCATVWCQGTTVDEALPGQKQSTCIDTEDVLDVVSMDEFSCGAPPHDIHARFAVTAAQGAGACAGYFVTYVVHEEGSPIL